MPTKALVCARCGCKSVPWQVKRLPVGEWHFTYVGLRVRVFASSAGMEAHRHGIGYFVCFGLGVGFGKTQNVIKLY